MGTRAILGPALVYTSHLDLASDKEIRFSSSTDPLGTKDLTAKRVAAATLGLTDGAGGAAKLEATSGGTGLTSFSAGDILYASNSTTLARLAKGTNGQALVLAAGLPSWGSAGAATLDDLTDVTITTPATGNLLRYNGSAWVNATTSTAIDTIGSTRGQVLYRGASAWSALSAGTYAGAPLLTGGAGADPSWATTAAITGSVLSMTSGLTLGWAPSTDPTAAQDTWLYRYASNSVILTGATGNRPTYFSVISPSTGTGAYAGIQVSRDNDTGSFTLICYSSSFTPTGIYGPGAFFQANAGDSLNFGTSGSAVVRCFYAAGFVAAWGSNYYGLVSGHAISWSSSSSDPTSTKDLGVSRISAGIAGLGNGSAADTSGTLRLTTLQAPTLKPVAITGTNQAGTALQVGGGLGTGTGQPGVPRVTSGWLGSSGTAAHTEVDRAFFATKTLTLSNTSATTTTYATLSTTSNAGAGCMVLVLVEASDGTDWCSATGLIPCSAVNKAATASVGQSSGGLVYGVAKSNGAHGFSLTHSVTTSGTSLALRIRPSWTTIVPTTVRITYTIFPLGQTSVTQA